MYWFRNIHPYAVFGTASDRYAGWKGQIYCRDYSVSSRTKKLAQKKFKEKTIEIRCVGEFFEHFDFLEIDFTFYQTLLNSEGQALSSFHVLSEYAAASPEGARFILKVPQEIVARHLWQLDSKSQKRIWSENPKTPQERGRLFTDCFYRPASQILGSRLIGFIFEYAYERQGSALTSKGNIEQLEKLFECIPVDSRYHIEERSEWLKTTGFYAFLRRAGLGNIFSHWSFLPSLKEQLIKSGGFTRPDMAIIRLLTPRGIRYEDVYVKFHPFSKLLCPNPEMIRDTVQLINEASRQLVKIYVAVNNRAEGNAPETTRRIASELNQSGLG